MNEKTQSDNLGNKLKGFTLVEVIIVIAIVGVLSALIILCPKCCSGLTL